MNKNTQILPPLPVRGDLGLLYAASLGIAVLMAVSSIAGLLFPASAYPAEELHRSFAPNDLANLAVGLPILLGSMGLASRGRLLGLLLWPGALLYIFYNYLIYVFCLPLGGGYLMYLLLIVMSLYATIGLAAVIDGEAVRARLVDAVPAKLGGGVLAGLGVLFLLRCLGILAGAVIGPARIPDTELAVNLSDVIVSPAWVIGGVLLWRRKALGYTGGLGLLFSLSMLFVGLIFIFILEPFLTAVPFRWKDALVILVMSMIIVVPLVFFLRGVIIGRKGTSG